MSPDTALAPIAPPDLRAPSSQSIRDYFEASWARYEWLFSGLIQQPELLKQQPHPFHNALAFYYGHSAAFYVQKLRLAGLCHEAVDATLDPAMERGVWPTSAGDIERQQEWPGAATLIDYRRRVYDLVQAVLDRTDLDTPITSGDPRWAILMGIEHECIHLQTSIPLIRRLPAAHRVRPEGWRMGPMEAETPVEAEWVDLPGGTVTVGIEPGDDRYFAWDNEEGPATHEVAPFAMRSLPITNREMLAFVEDGGYRQPALWQSAEARVWFDEMAPTHPAAWIPDDGGYRYRGIFDEIDMPWDWPVLVNRHEAAAFALWAGARLPTEAEFHHVRERDGIGRDATLDPETYNVGLRWGSPVPVGSLTSAIGPSGIDLYGNAARWAAGDFGPLVPETFRTHPLYEDFSEPWFRGDHGVLLGAGFSATGHLCQIGRMRDFMQNHMDQIAGITLVR